MTDRMNQNTNQDARRATPQPVDVLAMDSTTSPWTELFRKEAVQSSTQSNSQAGTETAPAHASERVSEAGEDERAALDALSAAFGE